MGVTAKVSDGFKWGERSISTTISQTISSTFEHDFSVTQEETHTVDWTADQVGKVAWRFVFDIKDDCDYSENTMTQEFALTPNADIQPCCLPGYATDAPSYMTCVNQDSMMANGEQFGCKVATNITTTTMPATTTAVKTTTMTTAAPSPAGAYKVVNPSSGKCIDICQRFNFSDGACIQLYACNGQANQDWSLQGTTIVNPMSGKCLDIYNHDRLTPDQYKDGTKVQLWSCTGQPNQHWEIRGGQLVNTPSGKCLDIDRFDFADTAKIQLHSCNGGANQDWTLQSAVFIGEQEVI